MQIILDICTFIGGIAAIGYFWEKCDKNNSCFPIATLIIVLAASGWIWYRYSFPVVAIIIVLATLGWIAYRWHRWSVKHKTTDNVEGPLAWDSPFYVERPPAESKSYEVITQPGALIRIIAPRKMGKTSLMMRINHHAEVQKYRTVYLSLDQVGGAELKSLDQFLQWFCISVTRKLQLPVEKVTLQWTDSILGEMDNCTEYFENVLLKEIHQPLVLGIDKMDKLFQYENLAGDFFGLLRAWHVQSVQNDIWQRLKLVLSYNGNVPPALRDSSPLFNSGTFIELVAFTEAQVETFVNCYKVSWEAAKLKQLTTLVGGHPYLLHLALHEIAHRHVTLDHFLQEAPTERGLYGAHLVHLFMELRGSDTVELVAALKQVVTSEVPIQIDLAASNKLYHLGLVKQAPNNTVEPLCGLYRHYFRNRLYDDKSIG